MSEFDVELRELAERLALPEPARSRMLLELRSDLESMAATLRARGVADPEARTRAASALLPSREAVAELGSVHRPLYERWVARLSTPGRHLLERALVAGVAAVYLGSGIGMLARFDLLASPSPFLWLVLLLAVVIATGSAAKLFELFALGARGGRGRRGLSLLLVLGVLTLLVALGGVAADLYVVAGTVQADLNRQLPAVMAWLQRAVVLGSTALLTASGAGLVWLLASVRIARNEQREIAALGSVRATVPENTGG